VLGVINCGSATFAKICERLDELNEKYEIISIAFLPLKIEKKYSGFIISGSPYNVSELILSKFMKRFEWIKKTKKPVLGICFGHEILSVLYGGKIKFNGWILKKEKIKIIKENDLFKNVKNASLFKEQHVEQITLPKDFMLLATSEDTKVEAIRHKTKSIYGVQFHPEISGKDGKTILKSFCDICKKNVA